ncbi:MAG: septum formation initiator family protein [Myxococcota bacterium]
MVHPPLIHRILLAAVPAFVLAAIVLTSIWGDNGLIRRMELTEELEQANTSLRGIQRENQRMQRQIKVLETDPIAAERAVAEDLEWAADGTVIYRFDAESTAP